MKELIGIKLGSECKDVFTIDLEDVYNIAIMRFDIYSSDIDVFNVLTSVDGKHYRRVASLLYNVNTGFEWALDPKRNRTRLPRTFDNKHYMIDEPLVLPKPYPIAKFVRFEAYNRFKVKVREISIWGHRFDDTSACMNDCSGHGTCDIPAAMCACLNGYTGIDCSNPPCLGGCGSYGTCVHGICECNTGYYGSNCEISSSCPNDCWGHGTCVAGRCDKTPGYAGLDLRYKIEPTVGNSTVEVLDLAIFPAPKAVANSMTNPTFANGIDYNSNASRTAFSKWHIDSDRRTATIGHLSYMSVVPPLVVKSANSSSSRSNVLRAVDNDPTSYWRSETRPSEVTASRREWYSIDLGSPVRVGALRFVGSDRHLEQYIASSVCEGSDNGIDWVVILSNIPNTYHGFEAEITTQLPIQFLRFSWDFKKGESVGFITIQEITIWGGMSKLISLVVIVVVRFMTVMPYIITVVNEVEGPFGPTTKFEPRGTTVRAFLGVNAIWGWGTDRYSDMHYPDSGPDGYSDVASHARNCKTADSYLFDIRHPDMRFHLLDHNLHWDIVDPDNTPNFSNMGCAKGSF